MKRARDGNQLQGDEQDIPPPPPPRTRPTSSRNGTQQQHQQQETPPPPPPRARPPPSRDGFATANGFSSQAVAASAPNTITAWSTTNGNPQPNGGSAGGNEANVFSGSSPSISSSSSVASNAPKRARLDVGQLDEIILKAGVGGRTKGEASGTRSGVDDASTRGGRGGIRNMKPSRAAAARSKRRFAVVCSANFNRSMMAHELLQEHNFQVESYGTSKDLRLPGKDIASPEVFPFGTPYRSLYDTLKRKDEAFFLKNNLLRLAARNATIKVAPQRFQDIEGPDMAGFDVVLCFEARVFYSVVEDLQSRDPEEFKPLHVINMTIKDSFEESAAASGNVLELCRMLDGLSKLEDEAGRVLEVFTRRSKRTVLHQVCHV